MSERLNYERLNVMSCDSSRHDDWIYNSQMVKQLEYADIVVFTGGADISPDIYGDVQHSSTYPSTFRDVHEVELFNSIVEHELQVKRKVLKFGICRGAQLLCALSGGKLIQDMDHSYIHSLKLHDENRNIQTNSIHHQMMMPYGRLKEDEYEVIASCNESKHLDYYEESISAFIDLRDARVPEAIKKLVAKFGEPEIIYFKNTHSLCVQGHPEMSNLKSNLVQKCNELIRRYV